MATRRKKKACCSACAAGRTCGSKPRRKRSVSASPISAMSDTQLRRFTSRDPKRLRGRSLDNWIRAKIRLLRHERYGEAQAVAIAMHMAGMSRPRPRRATPRRRTTTKRRVTRRRTTTRRKR